MRFELNEEEVFEILNNWCLAEHGSEISYAMWRVEDDKEFQGILIKCKP